MVILSSIISVQPVCINIDKSIFLNILFVHRVGEVIGLKRLIYFTGPPFVFKSANDIYIEM